MSGNKCYSRGASRSLIFTLLVLTSAVSAPGEVTVTRPDGGAPLVFRASRGIVINSGTEPVIPPIDGLAGTPYWTNREAIETEQVPRSLIVLGDGAKWIWEHVATLFGTERTEIVDWYHASEHVWTAAKALHGEDTPETTAWEYPPSVDAFVAYVRTVVQALGPRVRYYITLNEPDAFLLLGYILGTFRPA